MAAPPDITILVVNYRTRELTQACLESLLDRYPDVEILVIDNGSHDPSVDYLNSLANTRANVHTILNERNRYHGPALDQGVRAATSRYVFTLDSDCEIIHDGFLEQMQPLLEDRRAYAVGELRYKNRYGYTYGYDNSARPEKRSRIPYVHPFAMMIDRTTYLTLHPFVHHGAPCIKNMRDAQRAGYAVIDFPISDFIDHHLGGTSTHHGYGTRGRATQLAQASLNRLHGYVTRDPTMEVWKGYCPTRRRRFRALKSTLRRRS